MVRIYAFLPFVKSHLSEILLLHRTTVSPKYISLVCLNLLNSLVVSESWQAQVWGWKGPSSVEVFFQTKTKKGSFERHLETIQDQRARRGDYPLRRSRSLPWSIVGFIQINHFTISKTYFFTSAHPVSQYLDLVKKQLKVYMADTVHMVYMVDMVDMVDIRDARPAPPRPGKRWCCPAPPRPENCSGARIGANVPTSP